MRQESETSPGRFEDYRSPTWSPRVAAGRVGLRGRCLVNFPPRSLRIHTKFSLQLIDYSHHTLSIPTYMIEYTYIVILYVLIEAPLDDSIDPFHLRFPPADNSRCSRLI